MSAWQGCCSSPGTWGAGTDLGGHAEGAGFSRLAAPVLRSSPQQAVVREKCSGVSGFGQ